MLLLRNSWSQICLRIQASLSDDQSILWIDFCKYHSDSCMIRFVGARPYGTGHMGGAQYTTVSGQVNIAHAPPMVRFIKGISSCSR